MTAIRANGWTGFAILATTAALAVWVILAVFSAAGRHISSTAEDVAFVVALVAGVALIIAGVFALQRSGWQTTALLGGTGIVVLAITFWFSPTTW